MTGLHPIQIEALAHALAADGVAAHEARLGAVARLARRRDVDPVLVDILTDRDAPEISRLRAFGRLAAHLAHPRRRPGPPGVATVPDVSSDEAA